MYLSLRSAVLAMVAGLAAAASPAHATFGIFLQKPNYAACTSAGQLSCLCTDGKVAPMGGCPELAAPAATVAPPVEAPAVVAKPQKPVRPHRPAISAPEHVPATFGDDGMACVDGDLYDLLSDTYGWKPGLRACRNACIPRPTASLTDAATLDRRVKEAGLSWCPESCIKLSGYLPADEILAIEKQTGRKFCPTPAALACQAGDSQPLVPAAEWHEKVLTLIKTVPVPARSSDVALLVGIGDYPARLGSHPEAGRDVAAVRTALAERFGYAPASIKEVPAGTAAALRAFFGPGGPLSRLPVNGEVTIYISAVGYTDPATGKAYIVPTDADPARLAETSVPLQEIYTAIGHARTGSLSLWLEASFPTSLNALIDPPNLPGTETSIMPEQPIPGLTVITAADRDQATLSDPELGTGLFTRALLEGLGGAADAAPIGNDDRKIDSIELYVYTAHRVRITARKSFGLEQKPQMSEPRNALVRAF